MTTFYIVSATAQSGVYEDRLVGELDLTCVGPFDTKDEAIRFHLDVIERVHRNPEHAPVEDPFTRAGMELLEVEGRITNVRTPEEFAAEYADELVGVGVDARA